MRVQYRTDMQEVDVLYNLIFIIINFKSLNLTLMKSL